jgi:hypothetical protein
VNPHPDHAGFDGTAFRPRTAGQEASQPDADPGLVRPQPVSQRRRDRRLPGGVDPLWADAIDLHEVSLEANLGEGTEHDQAFVNFLADRRAGRPLDLVVPFSAPAMQFAVRNRVRLFGDTPFLIAGVKGRHMRPEILTPKTAVVGLEFNLPETIEGILRVWPRTTTIAVVLASSRVERFWRLEAQREFRI